MENEESTGERGQTQRELNKLKNIFLPTYKKYERSTHKENKYNKEQKKKTREENKRAILKLRKEIKLIQEEDKIKPIIITSTLKGYSEKIKDIKRIWKGRYNFIENKDSKKINNLVENTTIKNQDERGFKTK